MASATPLQYLVTANNQLSRINIGRPTGAEALKEAKELLGRGYRDVEYARHEVKSCCPMSSISLEDKRNVKHPRRQAARRAMNAKSLKTAYELCDMIVERAVGLQGPWPVGMTLFIFDDAYGWTASISRPSTEADNFYRTCVLDLTASLATEYDLNVPRLPNGLSDLDLAFSNPTPYLRSPQTLKESTWQKASKEATGKPRNQKRKRSS